MRKIPVLRFVFNRKKGDVFPPSIHTHPSQPFLYSRALFFSSHSHFFFLFVRVLCIFCFAITVSSSCSGSNQRETSCASLKRQLAVCSGIFKHLYLLVSNFFYFLYFWLFLGVLLLCLGTLLSLLLGSTSAGLRRNR